MLSGMNDLRVWCADTGNAISVARKMAETGQILPPTNPVKSALLNITADGLVEATKKSGGGEGKGLRERRIIGEEARLKLLEAFEDNPHLSRKKDLAILAQRGGF